jgi:amidophosphoribosyltransferase
MINQAIESIDAENKELYHPSAAENASVNAIEKWKMSHCAFRLFYKYPAQQTIGKRSVYDLRYEAGRLMASSVPEKVLDLIDYIIPVPDTGIAYADGFSAASGKKILHKLKKNGIRTFFMEDLRTRETSIASQIQIDDARPDLRGKRIALIDEAIFSGATLRIICRKLRETEVAGITVVIPVGVWRKQCNYKELPDHRILCDEVPFDQIARNIGADDLFVQDEGKLRDFIQEYDRDICYSCFCQDGAFP